ncbi:DeoR/GlpR family DNA-binding transcription regulator [Telluribacter sp. SYSU D00476]|uniref:DeoR/GlpR family DNA-binding transcription regulator n=1 Tax=Telluribacter sp. SYSU D00476 TaxID=2811430 RepID=UPI001FF3B47F|nr:DeoR/GlpR family DNA-binding transcription regulator [Telluribacter sp. SYSU D00476]
MLKDERQHWILNKLDKCKKVSLVAISRELAVSYDSIRRDIIELEERGLLKKVHGWAIANCYLPTQAGKVIPSPNTELSSIASKAQRLFRNGQTILMDGGITNLHIAEQIPLYLEATVITNSPRLAISLTNHPSVEAIILGGAYHKNHQITLGSETSLQLRHFKADLYFMGVSGIHPKEGITIRHYEESQLKRQMMTVAAHTIVCATTEKVNKVETYQVCQLRDVGTLITGSSDTVLESNKWPHQNVQIL